MTGVDSKTRMATGKKLANKFKNPKNSTKLPMIAQRHAIKKKPKKKTAVARRRLLQKFKHFRHPKIRTTPLMLSKLAKVIKRKSNTNIMPKK